MKQKNISFVLEDKERINIFNNPILYQKEVLSEKSIGGNAHLKPSKRYG